jgi:hypothetical protein
MTQQEELVESDLLIPISSSDGGLLTPEGNMDMTWESLTKLFHGLLGRGLTLPMQIQQMKQW